METLSKLSFIDIVPYIGKDRTKIEDLLQSYGIQNKRAIFLAQLLEEDWNTCIDIPDEKKMWALQHGFLPSRVKLYGLTENNCHDYLSDVDYYYLHPFNNHFAIWINDKLTLKYIFPSTFTTLEGRKLSIMPEYYLYIENSGQYSYLMDSPKHILHDENYLLNLLKEKLILALKPSRGQGGHGFVVLKYDTVKDKIYANAEILDESAFSYFRETLNGYVVTEYVKQHKELDSVWSESVCTLRIIALKNRDDKYLGGKTDILVSYARFGTSTSLGASNLSSQGVGIPYDFDTGLFGSHFYKYLKYSTNGEFKLPYHPDSKVSLSGKVLPHWEMVRDVVLSVCDYLSSLEYFGFDIMITDAGVKMCEINTFPSLDYEQVMCGPALLNPAAKKFFEKKMKVKLERQEKNHL